MKKNYKCDYSKNLLKKARKKGFTLVELIVVITILAILGSIAFVSLQGYSLNARDGRRITDMKSIYEGLTLNYIKSGKYPQPEYSSIITASGIVIRYQGYAGSQVLNISGLSGIEQGSGRDPKSSEFYTYITDGELKQGSIVGYLETGDSLGFINTAFASYTGGLMKSIGSDLGMIYDQTSSIPIHEKYPNGTTIDVKNTTTTYKIKFSSDIDEKIGTGAILFTALYNRDKYLLSNKELAKMDDSLVLYYDMETIIASGSILVLKDFSKYLTNGVCYDNNGATIINCGEGNGPKVENGYMVFDGNDNIQVNKNIYSSDMTVLLKIRPTIFDTNRHGIIGYYDGSNRRPFNFRLTNSSLAGQGGFHYDAHEGTSTSLSNACSTGKRCADNVTYSYNPNSDKVMQFYIAYRRKAPYINIRINGERFVDRNCRAQATNLPECPATQYSGFSSFQSDFNTFRIGRVDNFFKGSIDEVRVYNRYLSDDEVSSIYSSTVQLRANILD